MATSVMAFAVGIIIGFFSMISITTASNRGYWLRRRG